jgi:hypothetical protein
MDAVSGWAPAGRNSSRRWTVKPLQLHQGQGTRQIDWLPGWRCATHQPQTPPLRKHSRRSAASAAPTMPAPTMHTS